MNVLMISLCAPPKSGAESLQVYRYLKHLDSSRVRISLLTSTITSETWEALDSSIDMEACSLAAQIVLPAEATLIHRIKRRLTRKPPETASQVMLRSLKSEGHLLAKPDLVYSRSAPRDSHEIALSLLKHWPGVPHLAHISDPIWKNPYDLSSYSPEIEKLERELIFSAHSVTLTSGKSCLFYRARYPHMAQKFELLPNVYDDDDLQCPELSTTSLTESLRLIYTGNFYGARNPESLLRAFEALSQKDPAGFAHLKLEFAGCFDEQTKTMLQEFAARLPLINHGQLTAHEALVLQRQADVLVAIDRPRREPIDDIFFPSKLLDYLVAGKPILALTSPTSETHEFVTKGSRGWCAPSDDEEAILSALRGLLQDYRDRSPVFGRRPTAELQFSARENAVRLLELMRRVVGTVVS